MNIKIISGGQTGVDRAALDAAMKVGIECGGWCPRGYRDEHGQMPKEYHQHLQETETDTFDERTILNIQDAHATLILEPGHRVHDGTNLTIEQVSKQKKPYWQIDLSQKVEIDKITNWIISEMKKLPEDITFLLNVAGPRESQAPGIYQQSAELLSAVFSALLKQQEIKEKPIQPKV